MIKLCVVVAVAFLCCLVHANQPSDCEERDKDDFTPEPKDGATQPDSNKLEFEETEPNDSNHADRVRVAFHLGSYEDFNVEKLKVKFTDAEKAKVLYIVGTDFSGAQKHRVTLNGNTSETADFPASTSVVNRIVVQAKCETGTTCKFEINDMDVCLVDSDV